MPTTNDSTRRPAKGPRVALAQIAPSLGDTGANLERHREAIAKAVAEGADILVFPELSLAGYRLKDSVPDVAISRSSEAWTELEKLSADITLVVGVVEETSDHQFFNSAVCFEAGRTLAVHRKTYLPTYGMFDEQRYFARGRSIAAFDSKHGRIAMLVCEDMLHPSAVTIAACDGATMLIVPSASPARGVTGEGEADANARSWESYLQVMARSFGVWVLYCNRVGVEDGVSFWGGSEIVSPAGERLVKAAYYDEDFTSGVLAGDAVRRRRIVNPLVRDEDLDLTINELSRIRGRAVESTDEARPAFDKRPPRSFDDGERRPRFGDRERAPRLGDGEKPPRRFDRDSRDRDAPRFDRENRGRGEEGGFGPPRRPREDGDRFDKPRFSKPRFGGGEGEGDRPRFSKPRFGGEGDDRPRFQKPRFGGEGEDRPQFAKPRFGAPAGGRFGARDDRPRGRGGFGEGGFKKPGGFGGGGFKKPGGFGDGGFKKPGGFGGPRGSFGGPRDRDGEGGGFGGKPRFGQGGAPRERQRPEPLRKPFHKGAKPRGRGRRDD